MRRYSKCCFHPAATGTSDITALLCTSGAGCCDGEDCGTVNAYVPGFGRVDDGPGGPAQTIRDNLACLCCGKGILLTDVGGPSDPFTVSCVDTATAGLAAPGYSGTCQL